MSDSSILAGVDELIDRALGLEKERFKYHHKKRCQLFSKGTPPDLDGKAKNYTKRRSLNQKALISTIWLHSTGTTGTSPERSPSSSERSR